MHLQNMPKIGDGVLRSMNKVILKFTQMATGKILEIPLISKYSIITGLSGTGKTQFYNYVLDNDSPFVRKECEFPVITATSENINAIFNINNNMPRSVVFVDELLLKQHKMSEKLINQSSHLILSIGRDIPFIGYAPIESIFTIEREGDWFRLDKLMDVDQIPVSRAVSDYDFIVTEAEANRSEHEFLTRWCINKSIQIIPAGGKDNIHKILLELNKKHGQPKILVLTDLANFGFQYRLLMKRCKDNPNITFYDYASFEEMLFSSEFIHGQTDKSPFDFITLERFYETVLQDYTKNTPLSYEHGKSLSECYLKECESEEADSCDFRCSSKFKQIVGKDSSLLKLVSEPIAEDENIAKFIEE